MDEPAPSYARWLRGARESRQWTQREVAERLAELVWQHDGIRVGVNADMVSKWERGLKSPSRLYARHLRQLLSASKSPNPWPAPGSPHRLGGMLDAEGGDDVERREFLVAGVASGLQLLSGQGTHAPNLGRFRDGELEAAVEAVRAATTAHRRLDSTVPSSVLVGPVAGHLNVALGLLDKAPPGRTQRGAAAAASELAGLLAWIRLDQDDVTTAQSHYRAAARAGDIADEPALRAYMIGSQAQLVLEHGDDIHGRELVDQARRYLGRRPPATTRAWLDATEAVAWASAGDWGRAAGALSRADDECDEAASAGAPPWPWLMPFTRSKVAAQRATCALRTNRYAQVHDSMAQAADSHLSRKQRALLELTDAEGCLQEGDIAGAFTRADSALETGLSVSSARVVGRARDLRRRYQGRPTSAVRAFDERLHATYADGAV